MSGHVCVGRGMCVMVGACVCGSRHVYVCRSGHVCDGRGMCVMVGACVCRSGHVYVCRGMCV